MQHDTAIDTSQEALGHIVVAGDYGVGMVGAVDIDVIDSLIDIVHHSHGHDGVEILRFPVRVARRDDPRIDGLGLGIAAHLAARPGQVVHDTRQHVRRHGAVDQHRLRRAANPRAAHLGVQHNVARHIRVSRRMHIGVA